MKNDKLQTPSMGDPISAEKYAELVRTVQQNQAFTDGYMSGSVVTTRPPSGDTPPYKLVNCDDPEDVKIVANDLGDKVGKVVMVEGVCYKVEELDANDTCTSGVCVKIQADFKDCKECGGGSCCWALTPCSSGTTLYVRDCDFSKYSGQIIKWSDGNCYAVSASESCDGTANGSVQSVFSSCPECEACIELTECCSGDTRFFTSNSITEFQRQVGLIIKVNGTCYTVTDINATCPGNEVTGGSDGRIYSDCTECGCYVFQECSGGANEVKIVCRATHFGGGEFDLTSLKDGDVVTLGSPNSPQCFKFVADPELPDCSTAEVIEIIEVIDGCECCYGWELVECSSQGTTIVNTQNPELCEYYDVAAGGLKSGTVIKRAAAAPDDKCFDQMTKIDIGAAVTFEEFIIDTVSKDCPQCIDPVYKLTDADCTKEVCGGCGEGSGEPPKYTDEELSKVVGKIIKYDGICWEVSAAPGQTVDLPAPIEYEGPFEDCTPCLESTSCIEVVVDIDWANKKVKKKKYSITAVKCGESEEDIPTAPCP